MANPVVVIWSLILVVPLLMFGVISVSLFILAALGGWRRLAEFYHANDLPAGRRFLWQSGFRRLGELQQFFDDLQRPGGNLSGDDVALPGRTSAALHSLERNPRRAHSADPLDGGRLLRGRLAEHRQIDSAQEDLRGPIPYDVKLPRIINS